MNERDRDHDHGPGGPQDRVDEQERPRVRVTDRRRVRPDQDPNASGRDPDPAVAEETNVIGPGQDRDRPEAGSDLDAARRQAGEYREHLQRLQAEFDNYRKRVLKEQTRAVEMAAEPLVRRLLEVVDDFELALMAAGQKPDFERFLHGVELVYAKLVDTLRAEGVERIEADGHPFDPNVHEALMQTGEADGEPVVDDVLRQGYTMRGRVIRPAGVRVARR